MNDNWDKYLDPPDQPERIDCPYCGEEMEILEDFGGQKYTKCTNHFCPDKHDGVANEMAEKILELEYDLMRLKRSKNV